MRTLGNVLWLVLAGLWLSIGYAIAGVLACCTVVGIPFGVAAFRLAGYSLWPFGRSVIPSPTRGAASGAGNVVWFVLCGWWLALGHLVTGAILAVTVVGIPLAVANVKMVPLAFAPFGKQIVPASSVTPRDAVAVTALG